jgi:hypothetical protein
MSKSRETNLEDALNAGDEAELARMGYKQELKLVFTLPFYPVTVYHTILLRINPLEHGHALTYFILGFKA